MSRAQGYLVRLLRKVEATFRDGENERHRLVVERACLRLSHTDDLNEALRRLYCVQGFDQFALRLMWLFEHASEATNRLEGAVIDYDVESLVGALRLSGGGDGGGSRMDLQAPAQAMEAFYEALHRFDRVVDEAKRKSFDTGIFKGAGEDSLYRVLSEVGLLDQAARAAGQEDVVKFATACAGFIQYAFDHGLAQDVRIINMLDHANLTLQTVLAASGTEEYDPLQKNIELLQNPKEILS
jgi:hypothetical protein